MSALIARRTEGHTVPLAAFRRYFVTPDDSHPRTMRAPLAYPPWEVRDRPAGSTTNLSPSISRSTIPQVSVSSCASV